MSRYAAIAWVGAAAAGLMVAAILAGEPRIVCPPDATPQTTCDYTRPTGFGWVVAFLIAAAIPTGLALLFAYLVGVRRSPAGSVVAAVLGILAGAWWLLGLPTVLAGEGSAGEVARAAASALVILPGILSALAAREMGRKEEAFVASALPADSLGEAATIGRGQTRALWPRILLAIPYAVPAAVWIALMVTYPRAMFGRSGFDASDVGAAALVLAPWVVMAGGVLLAPRGTWLLVIGILGVVFIVPWGLMNAFATVMYDPGSGAEMYGEFVGALLVSALACELAAVVAAVVGGREMRRPPAATGSSAPVTGSAH